MIDFEETLRTIVERSDGAIGAVIMGLDGISVARSDARPGVIDIDVVAAEYTALLRKSMRTAEDDASLGEIRELVVVSDRFAFLITLITPEYFLLLALESPAGLGRARFELRKAQLELEEDFSV
jgi:predicted regulator of Ras-like GTPase activity (Roadblock/LC7/MglB family)